MKAMKKFGVLLVALLLVACGSMPSDGLTGAMQEAQPVASENKECASIADRPVSGCYEQLVGDIVLTCIMDVHPFAGRATAGPKGEIINSETGEIVWFGNGTGLTGKEDNINFGCAGEGQATAVSLQMFDKVMKPVWLTAINVPELKMESTSGGTQTVQNAVMSGLTAGSAKDVVSLMEGYGIKAGVVYEIDVMFTAQQADMVANYSNPGFMQEQALKSGLSKTNAERLGQLYTTTDVATQEKLLLDILTAAEDSEYAEAVVGATVHTLAAMGFSEEEIANLIANETGGRMMIDFAGKAGSVLDTERTNQDNSGNAAFTVYAQSSKADGSQTLGKFAPDLVWRMLMGAAAGGTLGSDSDTMAGGTVLGSLVGGADTVAHGFYNPDTTDPNSPCNSPFIFC